MSLRNSHIKKAVRKLFCKARKPGAVCHGGGNGADSFIPGGAIRQRLAEHRGKALPRRLFHQAGLWVKGTDAMEFAGVFFGKRISLTLYSFYMDHHGAVQFPGPLKDVTQPGQVVAVDGSQVSEAHVLEQSTPRPERLFQRSLDLVVKAVKPVFHRLLAKQSTVPFFKVIVRRFGPQTGQMSRHGTHIGVNGHSVVIENDDQRFF